MSEESRATAYHIGFRDGAKATLDSVRRLLDETQLKKLADWIQSLRVPAYKDEKIFDHTNPPAPKV